MDDWSLLQEYVHRGSKEALDQLVCRHLAMVYAAALRQVGDPDRAQDVTQVVFLVLMQRAARISRSVVLGGWLFQVTAFTASKMLRSQWRRQNHERKAAAMRSEIFAAQTPAPEQPWIAKLDEAIAAMPRVYRDAVVMRYLQGKNIHEVAQAQHVSENTARQRLFRALVKLRTRLRKNGLCDSEAVLETSLLALGCHAPPAAVTAHVLNTLHSSTATSASSTAADMVIRSMMMAKLKTVALTFVVLLTLCTVCGAVVYVGGSGNKMRPLAASPTQEPPTSGQTVQNAQDSPTVTLIAALNALHDGNAAALIASFEPLNAAQEALFRKAARGMMVIAELRSAIAAQFGQGAADGIMQYTIRIDPPAAMVVVMEHTQPTYNGDTAQIEIPHVGSIEFVKVGASWKLTSAMMQDQIKPYILIQSSAFLPGFQQVISNINAGQYTDIQQLRTDLRRMFMDMVQPDPMPPPDRPTVLGPGTTPRETLAALVWAQLTGNQDAAISCFVSPSVDQLDGIRVSTELFNAGEQIRSAIATKFGPQVARTSILALGLDTGISKQMLNSISVLPDAVTADRVQIDLPTLGLKMLLERSGGVWRIEPASLGLGSNPKWRARLHDYYLPTDLQFAADIRAGTYANVGELRADVAALHQELVADHRQYFAGK